MKLNILFHVQRLKNVRLGNDSADRFALNDRQMTDVVAHHDVHYVFDVILAAGDDHLPRHEVIHLVFIGF